MADDMLRLELERDLERFEKAGMNDHAAKTKARLDELNEQEEASSEEPQEEDLASLTKAELHDLADERGVEVSDSMTKAEMIDALEEG